MAKLGVVKVQDELLALLLEHFFEAALPQEPQYIMRTDHAILVNVYSAEGLAWFELLEGTQSLSLYVHVLFPLLEADDEVADGFAHLKGVTSVV